MVRVGVVWYGGGVVWYGGGVVWCGGGGLTGSVGESGEGYGWGGVESGGVV